MFRNAFVRLRGVKVACTSLEATPTFGAEARCLASSNKLLVVRPGAPLVASDRS